jgi:thiol-disulfide isomerase/thioredoxin
MANSKEPEKKEMGPMEKLLGAEEGFSIIKEMKKEGENEMIEVSKAFGADLKLLGLYFSMHNCPPCREFTPLLAEIYKEVNEDTK